jgi:acetyl esterase/lipase
MKLSWQLEEYLRVSAMFLDVMIENERRGNWIEERLKFGAHPHQYLLFLRPREMRPQKPLVYFLHGGGWGHGHPALFRFIGHFFARAGYPVILGGYRLTPLHRWPNQLDDAFDGLRAGQKLAAARGLEAGPVIVAGQSAGAQLASLMLLDAESAQRHRFRSEDFVGLLLISGLLNFQFCQTFKDRYFLWKLLGRRSNWPGADPIRFIRGDETVPVLCIHGERDILVDNRNSTSFINRLNHVGEIYLAPGAYHSDLTDMFFKQTPSTEVMLRWLERVSK